MKAEWGTARANDGRVLLEGPQTIYDEAGRVQLTATFHLGRKNGDENFYRADGSKMWQKSYAVDGTWTWRNFDAAGKQTSVSHWRGKTLIDASFR